MTLDHALYDTLAEAFTYPDEGSGARLLRGSARLAPAAPELASAVGALGLSAEDSLASLQETYTHTFDLSPVCALEIGWHLFGESYKRGVFLAALRGELRLRGLSEEGELPDHLATVLHLLARLPEDEDTAALRACTARALTAIARALRDFNGNPYAPLARAAAAAFGADASGARVPLHLPVYQSGVEMEATHD